jgi:hypothetical protein
MKEKQRSDWKSSNNKNLWTLKVKIVVIKGAPRIRTHHNVPPFAAPVPLRAGG